MAEKAEIVLSARDKSQAAFASARRSLDELQSSAAGLAGRFGSLGLALSGALAGASLKGAIDAADQLSKLEQKTGIAIESLSALKYAGALSDVSIEDLAKGIKKLGNNMTAAASGNVQAAASFEAIGVKVAAASGALRNTDDVIGDIADRFASYKDGAGKAALATELFGKNGASLIPFLNAGRKGMSELKEEAEKLGVVIGGDLGKNSEAFNDNLTRLAAAAEGAKNELLSGLLPTLVKISDEFIDARKAYGSFLSGFADNLNPNQTAVGGLEKTRGEIEALKASLVELDRQANSSSFIDKFNSIGTSQSQYKVLDQIEALEKRKKFQELQQQREALAVGAGIADERRFRGPAKVDPPRPRDTASAASAGAEAEALLRKQLEGRLKAIQSTLERERDLFQFSESQLGDQYARGELSIAQFYDKKNQIQLDFLAVQSKAGSDEVAAFKEFQAKLSKPADKADLGNRQVESIERQAKAFREAGQSATVSEQARVRATEDFQRSLVELDAQLADLTGNKYGAELLRNAQRLDDARNLLAKGGGDPARETALRARLAAQASFNDLQQKSARISEQAQNEEEAFLIKATRLGLSRNDTESELLTLRDKSLASLDDLTRQTAELTKVSTDPELLAFYDRIKLARERAFDAKDPGLVRFNELAAQAGSTIASSFEDAVFSGKKLSDIIKDLDTQLAKLVFNDLVTQPLSGAITGGIKGIGSGGSGGGSATFISGLFSKIGAAFSGSGSGGSKGSDGVAAAGGLSAKDLGGYFDNSSNQSDQQTADYAKLAIKFFSSFFHGGGVVGAGGGTARAVNPAVFEGAARYHGGGLAGLAPDEVPAILRKREEVIRTDDPRHRDNGGMYGGQAQQPLVLNVSAPAGMDRKTANQYGADIGTGLQRALRRNG